MIDGSNPLVSVVVPVYNGARYISECLASILAQTYRNWDCTVINNCSTDGTAAIARDFAAKDFRIRVRDNEQLLPPVANYNNAVRQISPESKYCKVVFADDWIFPECLERMVAVAERHPSVGIVGAYGLEGALVKWAGLPYPSTVISGREVCRRLFLDRLYVFGSATSLLYRADLVRARQMFYNELNIHSDMEVCVSVLRECDFGFVHQILTYTREEEPGCLRSISAEWNTYAAGALHNLVRYGREFLSPEEYSRCLDELVSRYYRTVAGAMFRGRGREFWNYHKKKLAEVGVELSIRRVGLMVLQRAFSALLNPKDSIEKCRTIVKDARSHRHLTGRRGSRASSAG